MAIYPAIHEKRVGVAVEGTYGVVGTHRAYIPCEFEADYKRDGVIRPNVGGNRIDRQVYRKEGVLTPKVTMSLESDGVGEIFKTFFGTNSVAAAGAGFRHTFTPIGTISDTIPSLSFKVDYGQGVVFDYTGCRGNGLTIDCKAKDDIKLTCDFIGKTETAGTRNATLNYGTFAPFIFAQVNMLINGTAVNPYNLTLDFKNNLSDGFRIGTSFDTTKPLPNAVMTGEIKFDIENDTTQAYRAIYKSNTNYPIDITIKGSDIVGGTFTSELRIKLPNVAIMTAPFKMNEGLMAISVGGQVLEGTNTTGTGAVTFELQNSVASY